MQRQGSPGRAISWNKIAASSNHLMGKCSVVSEKGRPLDSAKRLGCETEEPKITRSIAVSGFGRSPFRRWLCTKTVKTWKRGRGESPTLAQGRWISQNFICDRLTGVPTEPDKMNSSAKARASTPQHVS